MHQPGHAQRTQSLTGDPGTALDPTAQRRVITSGNEEGNSLTLVSVNDHFANMSCSEIKLRKPLNPTMLRWRH